MFYLYSILPIEITYSFRAITGTPINWHTCQIQEAILMIYFFSSFFFFSFPETPLDEIRILLQNGVILWNNLLQIIFPVIR